MGFMSRSIRKADDGYCPRLVLPAVAAIVLIASVVACGNGGTLVIGTPSPTPATGSELNNPSPTPATGSGLNNPSQTSSAGPMTGEPGVAPSVSAGSRSNFGPRGLTPPPAGSSPVGASARAGNNLTSPSTCPSTPPASSPTASSPASPTLATSPSCPEPSASGSS